MWEVGLTLLTPHLYPHPMEEASEAQRKEVVPVHTARAKMLTF